MESPDSSRSRHGIVPALIALAIVLVAGIRVFPDRGQSRAIQAVFAQQDGLMTRASSMIGQERAGSTVMQTAANSAPLTVDSSSPIGKAFPHMVLYGGANSLGWPFVGTLDSTLPAANAPLNQSVINYYARFPYVILPTTPLSDGRPDIVTALRTANPNLTLFAYDVGNTTWCPMDAQHNISYPVGYYYRDYWLAVTSGDTNCDSTSDRLLWDPDGTRVDIAPHDVYINVNVAHAVTNPDGSKRYDVAEALADTMYAHSKRSKGFDGIFVDIMCPNIAWIEHDNTSTNPAVNNATHFDYVRAGYMTHQAFLDGWLAGYNRMAQRLREDAIADGDPDYPISGNCAQAPASIQPYFNGWMREGYPFQNTYAGAADFYSNMLAWPWGYLHQDVNFKSPQLNYIFTAAQPNSFDANNNPVYIPSDSTTAWNQRKMRFGLGSASLGNGVSAFHDSSGNPFYGQWFSWWYDEYAVNTTVPQSDPSYGTAMTGSLYTGWLGQPKGPAYQMLSNTFNSYPNLLTTNTGFESTVTTPGQVPDWSFLAFSGATGSAQRDTSTATEGIASVRLTVTSTSDPQADWAVMFRTGSFPVIANTQYSITFKAKADRSRPLGVTFVSNPGATYPQNAIQTLQIDDQWRQYQAVVRATTGSLDANLSFQLGYETGTYWIDDVHVQTAVTSVWRRDFDKGAVLVNPGQAVQTVTLEQPFKKIKGTINPTLNDGSTVSSVSLQGTNSGGGIGDAIFLLSIDNIPPARITNLTGN